MDFQLKSVFKPTGDQPQAIAKLVAGIRKPYLNQTLLGVTGSGKTFTIANVIAKTNLPTLIISHNKTLAGQLYQEFRDFFPQNGVSFFISYYDFYQPEAYIPQSNTYIEKEADVNELIDKLRLQATSNILSRQDVIVVASVSCIYNIGRPESYQAHTLFFQLGRQFKRQALKIKLVKLQYSQNQFAFVRGTFRERGEYLDIYLSYTELALRVHFQADKVTQLQLIDPLTGAVKESCREFTVYAAKHYLVAKEKLEPAFGQIEADLKIEVKALKQKNKLVEAQRLEQRVKHDLEMLNEVGYVSGIENYSRYFDGRRIGEPPYSLLDYFQYSYGNNWLLIIDESHMTVPQLNGMHRGDQSRKQNLIDYGFRLKAALDNRPLKFSEFLGKIKQTIFLSATPAEWEVKRSEQVVEQLVRPTGIPDPKIKLKPVYNQINDLIEEIAKRAKKKQRVLVTTLTKRIAEDLSLYLKNKGIKAHYLHSDVKTLERSDTLDSLRKGDFDVLIGINLLREGLDLPEVTLVAILDADREGFLRSKTALIQTMGRAARNIEGEVIIYTDKMTKSIKGAIEEVQRRRKQQLAFNKMHKIIPKNIYKPIREKLILESNDELNMYFKDTQKKYGVLSLSEIKANALTSFDKKKLLSKLKRQMKREAENLNFEFAATIRDKIIELSNISDM